MTVVRVAPRGTNGRLFANAPRGRRVERITVRAPEATPTPLMDQRRVVPKTRARSVTRARSRAPNANAANARQDAPATANARPPETDPHGGYHYEFSNEFYALWLDATMTYSCAYFGADAETLESAQMAKVDLAFAKVDLRPGHRLLDIGCGWGAAAERAARLIRRLCRRSHTQPQSIRLRDQEERPSPPP